MEEDAPSSERDFAPMEPVRTLPYNYEQDIELDGTIEGVRVVDHLVGEEGQDSADEGGVAAERNFDRYMRGEIEYNEYMRLTGGQTVEEELEEGHLEDEEDEENDIDDEDDEEDITGDDTCDEMAVKREVGSFDVVKRERYQEPTDEYITPSSKASELPAHVRHIMNEVVNEDANHEVMAPSRSERERIPRKLSKTMDALLGQANLIYARGQTKEALTMLLEVIRQEPRNAIPYQQVSDIYGELGDQEKSLQYGLLSAHLDTRTSAETWSRWGELSKELKLLQESAACFGRAIRVEPQNWHHYEKRIECLDELGLRPISMKTRLQAAQMISHQDTGLDFEWFHSLIKAVAQYYIMINDEDRAISALEAFVLRSKEFGKTADGQHETLIGMWMSKNRYTEAAKSILALCEGIRVLSPEQEENVLNITLSNGTYAVDPFPPPEKSVFSLDENFSIITLTRLIVCFIGIDQIGLASSLKELLLARNLSRKGEEPYILDVARAYYNVEAFKVCKVFLEQLQEWHNLYENDELWFIYGNTLSVLRDNGAMEAFERALQLNPSHVDARINLSTLQQKAGDTEKALETLQGYDLDTCTHLPDERLLIRQADVLFEQKKTDQFVRCVRMLLTPHFYEIHRQPDLLHKRRQSKTISGIQLSNTLRVVAMNTIQNSSFEKFVKRLGSIAAKEGRCTDDIDPIMLHDYCLKLIECFMSVEKYHDMLIVCCYAFLQPRLNKFKKSSNFQNILYFAAIKANSWALAFEYVRWFHTIMNSPNGSHVVAIEKKDILHKRIFNAMNYVFCHSQNVSYHRYIMRALAKTPENQALQTISGNNSLITGTYRHALGEYLRVWSTDKKNPLISLLLALTFTHMSCKKDLSSRHMIAVRAIGFMKVYQKNRTCQQEVYYNIARMFHQMSITPIAIHYYEKVLSEPSPIISIIDEEGNEKFERVKRYNLEKLAAHNLALIYRSSGNDYLARKMYEQYVVI
ncbi:unnamed protein product [Auanema sp. JU1783]|nr:unnamed protein product [Auanema sp. JU1783]